MEFVFLQSVQRELTNNTLNYLSQSRELRGVPGQLGERMPLLIDKEWRVLTNSAYHVDNTDPTMFDHGVVTNMLLCPMDACS